MAEGGRKVEYSWQSRWREIKKRLTRTRWWEGAEGRVEKDDLRTKKEIENVGRQTGKRTMDVERKEQRARVREIQRRCESRIRKERKG